MVFLALKEFQDLCSNNIVLVATDNTTVFTYINKEGGMKSGSLCALLWRILSWCTRKQVTLKARHIPGRLNVIADKLSRLGQTIQTEWSLHPEVFQAICSYMLYLICYMVLHQLSKAPFEPLKEASLKHLTFKTVFLLALGSGKRRSEIHDWLHKNIRRQSDWSKVSLYPSPSFLSKNQLAKEGTDSLQWSYQPWPPLWISHSKVTGPCVQLEPFAITWIGPQILGRTRSWS